MSQSGNAPIIYFSPPGISVEQEHTCGVAQKLCAQAIIASLRIAVYLLNTKIKPDLI
jgi:hypothetical protein